MKCPHAIVIIHPELAVEDEYGTPSTEPDWSQTTETETVGFFQPTLNTEIDDERMASIKQARVFFPKGTVLYAYDRINYRGQLYEVKGEPEDWTVGSHTHLEVNVQRVTG